MNIHVYYKTEHFEVFIKKCSYISANCTNGLSFREKRNAVFMWCWNNGEKKLLDLENTHKRLKK